MRFLSERVGEEEEVDEGMASGQEQSDEAEAVQGQEPEQDENEAGREEADELATYGLDRYDEEDSGKYSFCICSQIMSDLKFMGLSLSVNIPRLQLQLFFFWHSDCQPW